MITACKSLANARKLLRRIVIVQLLLLYMHSKCYKCIGMHEITQIGNCLHKEVKN